MGDNTIEESNRSGEEAQINSESKRNFAKSWLITPITLLFTEIVGTLLS